MVLQWTNGSPRGKVARGQSARSGRYQYWAVGFKTYRPNGKGAWLQVYDVTTRTSEEFYVHDLSTAKRAAHRHAVRMNKGAAV